MVQENPDDFPARALSLRAPPAHHFPLLPGNDVVLGLENAVRRDGAPDRGGGINAGVPANDRAGV